MASILLTPAKQAELPIGNGIYLTQSDGTVTTLYEPTDKQREFHLRTEPNVLFWGGRGSGKSMAIRWEAHMRALSTPNFKYVILRRNFPELNKTHLIHVPREMKLLGGTYNQTDHVAKYPNGSLGFFSHCNTEEDVLNLLGAEFYWMGVDEISTFEWDMFTRLAASVRAPKGMRITPMVRAATNPFGASAQKLKDYFVDKNVDRDEDPDYNPDDWFSIQANLEHNPHLDYEQYRKRFSGLPAHMRKAWLDGEFVLENQLFELHPNIEGKPYHVINDIDLKKIIKSATVYRAIDAGWFPDPTVVLWIAHLGNRHIVFNEMIRYKTIAVDIAEEIKEEDARLGITNVAMTYCDPSMDINTTADVKTLKEVYEANGIAMENSVNKRDMYATVMHNALAEESTERTPRIQFYVNGPQGCPYLVRTLPQMRYDQKRPSFMADHKEDHSVVACCYYLLSHSSDPRTSFEQSTSLRPWMKPKAVDHKPLGYDQVRERS